MEHIVKNRVFKKLTGLLMAVAVLISTGFIGIDASTNSSTIHEVTIQGEEVLRALVDTAKPAEPVIYQLTIKPPVILGALQSEVGQPTTGQSTIPGVSNTAPSTLGTSEGTIPSPGQSGVPGQSDGPTPGESSVPEQPIPEDPRADVQEFLLDPSIFAIADKIDLPFGSTLMKAELLKQLEGKRLVRFYGHADIGCDHCQAIVAIDPAMHRLSIYGVNASETERHTLSLSLVDDEGKPLRLNDATASNLSAEKKVYDCELADANLPADALVEVLKIVYEAGSAAASDTTSSAAGGISSDEHVQQSDTSSSAPDAAAANGQSESISETGSEPAAAPLPDAAVDMRKNTSYEPSVEQQSGTSSADDSSQQQQEDSLLLKESSEEISSEESSLPAEDSSSQAALEESSSEDVSSSDSSSQAPASSDQPQEPTQTQVQTTVLLLSQGALSIPNKLLNTPLAIESGFAALDSATLPPFDLATIKQSKTAQLKSEADRTYDILLKTWADAPDITPVEIVLVLDASGSMPWLMTQPTTTKRLSQLSTTEQGSPNPATFSYYKFFINIQNEYRPIEYLTSRPASYEGTFSQTGWYRIESQANGNKNLVGRVTDANTTVYVKGKQDKTKLEMLQESANNFVASVAAVSPDSKISVVTFANDQQIKTICNRVSLSSSSNLNSIYNGINGIQLAGGTRQELGLERALTLLRPSTIPRYAILFTDGQPTDDSTWPKIKTAGNNIKNLPATLFTTGLFGGGVTNVGDIEKELEEVASPGCYFNAGGGLSGAFEKIFSNIADGLDGARITDVVNARFELTAESASNLRANGASIEALSDGTQRIIWNNQAIPATGDADTGWTRSFTVVAKDYYVGGNQVPTNTGDSCITYPPTPDFKLNFSMPLVNVPLRYDLSGKNAYLYAGDAMAQPAQFAGAGTKPWNTFGDSIVAVTITNPAGRPLAERPTEDTPFVVKAVVTPKTAGAYTAQAFNSAQMNLHLLSPAITLTDKTVFAGEQTDLRERSASPQPVWQYRDGGTWKSEIPATWVYAGSGTAAAPVLSYSYRLHGSSQVVNGAPLVTLTEKTDLDIFAHRSGVPDSYSFPGYARYQNTSKNAAQGSGGWFTIDVITGKITVTKKIDQNWAPHGDPIFVYTLEKKDANGAYREVGSDFVRFTGGSSGAGEWSEDGCTNGTGEKSILFESLGAGTYRLTELQGLRYGLSALTASSNGLVSAPDRSVEFTINTTSATGFAKYENTKEINRWLSHTDVAKNSFKAVGVPTN